jgi:hypothetical protein
MKSDGVDAWLQHWLKMQKRNKRPLVLKDDSDESCTNPPTASKRKSKASNAQPLDDDNSDDEPADKDNSVDEDEPVDEDDNPNPSKISNTNADATLPPTPLSASDTRNTRRTFLTTLADDQNYQRLIQLLRAAKVSYMPLSNTLSNISSEWRLPGG